MPVNVDLELLEHLKAWRLDKSRELKVPAYVVFSDNTLMAIAEQRPQDNRGLVSIPGIGPKKLDNFGEDVLAVIRGELRAATLDI
ncbi:hypothetical protein GCM10020255_070530 [Rhodococcus baikonurensis]